MPNRSGWITLVEAAYDLSGDEPQWLRRVLDGARPLLNVPGEPLAWSYRCSPNKLSVGEFAYGTSRMLAWLARTAHRFSSQASFDLTYRGGHVIDTASNLIFPRMPDMQRMFLGLMRGRAQDLLVIDCRSGTGHGVAIGALLKQPTQASAEARMRWPQAAAHIGAALRLRQVAGALSLDMHPVEAILDASGKLHDARRRAQPRDARERLREAVRRIEHIRSRAGHGDNDSAIDHWQGLVDGRWSMLDRFDSDGRRYIVAVKNDPQYSDPRGLTRRERQVAEFVGMGRANGEIAYALGVSDQAVSNYAAQAQQKLGLTSRGDLVAFFSHNGARRKLAEIAVAGEQLLVGSHALPDARKLQLLSEAEQAVVAQLVAGSTIDDIAKRRGTSRSTVAAQVYSIYQKLGVSSRGELTARLLKAR